MTKEAKYDLKSLSEVWEIKDSAMHETTGLSLSDAILKRIKDSVKTTKKLKLKTTQVKR